MSELNVIELKKELADKLIESGVPEEEANRLASKEVDSTGAIKTMTDQCPLGKTDPMACMFCRYGHMTNCHYSKTCEEANCSHYQAEMEAEGYYPEVNVP